MRLRLQIVNWCGKPKGLSAASSDKFPKVFFVALRGTLLEFSVALRGSRKVVDSDPPWTDHFLKLPNSVQRPHQRGARFSAKARGPSSASVLASIVAAAG